jgi:hypothetical protein
MPSGYQKDQWIKEFSEFSSLQTDPSQVPTSAFQRIKARLFPNPWVVFGKILALHALVGFCSLSICNQFGLNPFQTSQTLTDWFMSVAGHHVCMIFCGTFFMASTYALANLFLSLEELESIKRFEWLQSAVIAVASLAAFYFFGAQLFASFAALWLLGALIGGLFSIEGSYRLRRLFNSGI